MNAIEIRDLTKSFGDKQALRGLNMTVPIGSVYGFIGENGSGKSTAEKIICGLSREDGGSVKLFGKSPSDRTRERIGALIEFPGCFPSLSVWDNLMLRANDLGLSNPQKHVREILELVRMEGAAGNRFKNCSLGMRQRIGLACALIGDPKLLVLDEPINGLDADGVRIVRETLILAAERGTTVLVSSHILGELEKVATAYGIIRDGRMIKEISAAELERTCRSFVHLDARDLSLAESVLKSAFRRVEKPESGGLRVYDETTPDFVARLLFDRGVTVTEIGKSKIGLEEYYADVTNGKENA